jgi:hypothetical protein
MRWYSSLRPSRASTASGYFLQNNTDKRRRLRSRQDEPPPHCSWGFYIQAPRKICDVEQPSRPVSIVARLSKCRHSSPQLACFVTSDSFPHIAVA